MCLVTIGLTYTLVQQSPTFVTWQPGWGKGQGNWDMGVMGQGIRVHAAWLLWVVGWCAHTHCLHESGCACVRAQQSAAPRMARLLIGRGPIMGHSPEVGASCSSYLMNYIIMVCISIICLRQKLLMETHYHCQALSHYAFLPEVHNRCSSPYIYKSYPCRQGSEVVEEKKISIS